MTKRANSDLQRKRPKRLTKNKLNLKKISLRNNEYYDFQKVQDNIFAQSKEGATFHNLVKILSSDKNLQLAFRNIKTNKGSHTAGVNGKTIKDYEEMPLNDYLQYMKNRINYYVPLPIRRVEIPNKT